MKDSRKLTREEVNRTLSDFHEGRLSATDVENRYGFSVDQLRQWQSEKEKARATEPYQSDRVGQATDVLLGLVFALGVAIFVVSRFIDEPIKDHVVPILLAVGALSALALVYQDIRRGMVKFGKWKRFYRDEQPVAFYLVITVQTLLISAFALAMLVRGLLGPG